MDPEHPTPIASPNVPEDDGTEAIQRVLESLVPEAGAQVQWRDVTGALHRAPPHASLRTQARLTAVFREHSGLLSTDLSGASQILAALADPRVLDAVVQLFEILHPSAARRARDHVRALRQGESSADPESILAQAGVTEIDQLATQDLFAGEELVDAILPFCAGPLLRLIRLAGRFNG